MNEYQLRELVVRTAKSYINHKESNGSHKEIIDLYNSHRPLARGYKVRYDDAWCATFVSAVAIKCGLVSIMPTECSCSKMIDLYKAKGRWMETDSYIPAPGDLVMYDWEDNGNGDNKGNPDHVGIVVDMANGWITVIEGNYNNSVKYRNLNVNGKYIRGFCLPDFEKSVKSAKVTAVTVLEFQKAAIADGFKFPKYGADGKWGSECASVAEKAIVKKRLIYTNKNLTKLVQRVVGVTVDGLCGKDTKAAIIAYQKSMGLTADGEVGINTWKKILGVT